MLRFHNKTISILPENPSVMANANALLEEVQCRLGIPLPASVQEWYSLKNGYANLRAYSNSDHPLELSDFGVKEIVENGRLVFKWENQGVCRWAIRINGSEDPPVDVSYDGQAWETCAETFSEYVFSCVWDCRFVLDHEPLIQAQHAPLIERALQSLKGKFHSGIATHGWPGHTQYRFESNDQHILIWASHDQSDWFLAAESDDALSSLLSTVWEIDLVGRSFWSNSTRGEELIAISH